MQYQGQAIPAGRHRRRPNLLRASPGSEVNRIVNGLGNHHLAQTQMARR